MALIVILCSFGKKNEKAKEAPEKLVETPQEDISTLKKHGDGEFADTSQISYTLLDTYKNTTSSIN